MNKRQRVVIRIVVDGSWINKKRIYHLQIHFKNGGPMIEQCAREEEPKTTYSYKTSGRQLT